MQVSLLATDCIDVVVEHNLLTGGSSDASLNCGLKVIDSTGVVVRFNAVENNLLGVVLAASNTSLMDVVVYHNNLRLNVVHAIDNCGSENQWDNGYPDGGNYWAGVIVTDVDGDGIGDEEHYIDSDSVDRYPLIAPLSL
jgi:nitrous oxidase accessory protein NosD